MFAVLGGGREVRYFARSVAGRMKRGVSSTGWLRASVLGSGN
jgi:hypothetical protein